MEALAGHVLIVGRGSPLIGRRIELISGLGSVRVTGPCPPEGVAALLSRDEVGLVLMDVEHCRDRTGIPLLEEIRGTSQFTNVVLTVSRPTVESAVEALRGGALDYLIEPVADRDLLLAVEKALRPGSEMKRSGSSLPADDGSAGPRIPAAPTADAAEPNPPDSSGKRSGSRIAARMAAAGGSLRTLERIYILEILRRCGGNKKRAAMSLGIHRSSLYSKLRRHGIDPSRLN